MRLTNTFTAAMAALGIMGCASNVNGTLGGEGSDAALLAEIDTAEGHHLGFYEVEPGYIALTVELPEGATFSDLLPRYQELTMVELYEAITEEPAPGDLVAAQTRLDELAALEEDTSVENAIEVPEVAADEDRLGRVAQPLSSDAFRQLHCFPLSTIDRCLLDENTRGNRTLYTERGDRIEFWTTVESGSLTMELRRSNFLGTFYSRVGTRFVPSTGCFDFGLIASFSSQRNLRARVLSATSGTSPNTGADYHAAVHVTP